MSTLMYTGPATRSRIRDIIPDVPNRSRSRAVRRAKPQRSSFWMSPLGFANGARMPAWIEVLRMRPCEVEVNRRDSVTSCEETRRD